ncbi:MAG: hypothetical protein IH595_12830 [Bacteroidales bacterium]|nr:hypothetical protein [Bacteroidales bacterium]
MGLNLAAKLRRNSELTTKEHKEATEFHRVGKKYLYRSVASLCHSVSQL